MTFRRVPSPNPLPTCYGLRSMRKLAVRIILIGGKGQVGLADRSADKIRRLIAWLI